MTNLHILLGTPPNSPAGAEADRLARVACSQGHRVLLVHVPGDPTLAPLPYLATPHMDYYRDLAEHLRSFAPDVVLAVAPSDGLWLQWNALNHHAPAPPKLLYWATPDDTSDAHYLFEKAANTVAPLGDPDAVMAALGDAPPDNPAAGAAPGLSLPSERFFDPHHYAQIYPDLTADHPDLWTHFRDTGWYERRDPHPFFNAQWYMDQNSDIADIDFSGFDHFILHGWHEGRSPFPGRTPMPLPVTPEVLTWEEFNPFAFLTNAHHDFTEAIRALAPSNIEAAIQTCTIWADLHAPHDTDVTRILIDLQIAGNQKAQASNALWRQYLASGRAQPSLAAEACILAFEAGALVDLQSKLDRLAQDWPHYLGAAADETGTSVLAGLHCLHSGRPLEAYAWTQRCLDAAPDNRHAKLMQALALDALESPLEALFDLWQLHLEAPLVGDFRGMLEDWGDAITPENSDTSVRWSDQDADTLKAALKIGGAQGGQGRVAVLNAFVGLALTNSAPAAELALGAPDDAAAALLHARACIACDDLHTAQTIYAGLPPDGGGGALACLHHCFNADLGGQSADVPDGMADVAQTGRALARVGAYQAAITCFQAALDTDPDAPSELLGRLASCHLHLGQFILARAAAGKALETAPDDGRALAVMVDMARRFGGAPVALAGVRGEGLVPSDYLACAIDLDRARDRSGAIATLQSAADLFPTDAKVAEKLDVLKAVQKMGALAADIAAADASGGADPQDAREAFTALATNFADPERPLSNALLAEVQILIEKVQRKGINGALHEISGDILVRNNNKFDAIGHYERACHAFVADAKWAESRAVVVKIIAALEQQNLLKRAIEFLDAYVQDQPVAEHQQYYRRIACFAAMTGQRDRAYQAWTQLLETSS